MSGDTNDSRFFKLKTGREDVFIETLDNTPQSGPVARRGTIEEARGTLEEALAQTDTILTSLKSHVRTQLEDADEVSIEFGIKITAEANVVVAKSQLEGNFKISIKWKK